MDADTEETPGDLLSLREKRWSMNSQRLEEIVAELMKPISDLRRSFDMDQSALLEEYLTEAGLHALEAAEESDGEAVVAVNFAELALLLQQSACIYARKVDCLYQNVLSVSDALHTNVHEESIAETADTPGSRRKRKSSVCASFELLELEGSSSAAKAEAAHRPPPTLPRLYVELEPRTLGARDVPLLDYAGEPLGLHTDFHVNSRLHNGLLVDELDESASAEAAWSFSGVPLAELQAALDAAAPPSPPPEDAPCCADPLPLPPSPPLLPTLPSLDECGPMGHSPRPLPLPCERRKRKCDLMMDLNLNVLLRITGEMSSKLRKVCEFAPEEEWMSRITKSRAMAIKVHRKRHTDDEKGFSIKKGNGFVGFSASEAAAALALVSQHPAARDCCPAEAVPATTSTSLLPGADSDDDGFFEQSSLGDSDGSLRDDVPHQCCGVPASWLTSGGTGPDVRVESGRVLTALEAALGDRSPQGGSSSPKAPFSQVLLKAQAAPRQVATLFLATLFLANSGNVQIVPGRPLAMDDFHLQLTSSDLSRVTLDEELTS